MIIKGTVIFSRVFDFTENRTPVIVIDADVRAGDHVVCIDDTIGVVNQATCVLYDKKIVLCPPVSWDLTDGEEVDLVYLYGEKFPRVIKYEF